LQAVALLVMPLWWAGNIRQQRQMGALMAEQARREAVDGERSAMARELHDAIASHLSTTAIHSGGALALPPDAARDRDALRAVRSSSLAALEELRTMIAVLRASGDDAVVAPGLSQLPQALDAARADGLDVSAEVRPAGVSPVVDQAAYRIVSEALTNARKHAPGSRVWVAVGPSGNRLAVRVTNTLNRPYGRHHAARDPTWLSSGTGLLSMCERATLVGGELRAGSDGDMWKVSASLPLSEVD
jgi:signal transduction histidine kinase